MPQDFHVLKCYNCNIFQVHIVKKSQKWSCKMCGEKQSVKKNYGQGGAKECRIRVQELNMSRISQETSHEEIYENLSDCGNTSDLKENTNILQFSSSRSVTKPEVSKWHEFLTAEEQEEVPEINEEYTFERPSKRKRQQKCASNKPTVISSDYCVSSGDFTIKPAEFLPAEDLSQEILLENDELSEVKYMTNSAKDVRENKSEIKPLSLCKAQDFISKIKQHFNSENNDSEVAIRSKSKWGVFVDETEQKSEEEFTLTAQDVFTKNVENLDDVLNF